MADSIIQGDVKITGGVKVGGAVNPAEITAGSGAMDVSNKADGSLHLRSGTDVLPEVRHNGVAKKLAIAGIAIEARMSDLTANQATVYTTYMPVDGKITGVSRRFLVKPASSSGTVVTGVTVNGNAILATASEDEEAISNDTLTAHNLTGTAANLIVSAGDKVVITVTSNNADMTGGTEPIFFILFDQN